MIVGGTLGVVEAKFGGWDGAGVGKRVGVTDGTIVGNSEGADDKVEVGKRVGTSDGTEVGDKVGLSDGFELGNRLGVPDAGVVGDKVGLIVIKATASTLTTPSCFKVPLCICECTLAAAVLGIVACRTTLPD